MNQRVTVSVEGGVADVRLNRPDKLNAVDLAMFLALAEAVDAVAADPAVRAVVLSGEGRGFCAGLDFASFRAMAGQDGGGSKGAGDDVELTEPQRKRVGDMFGDPRRREPGRIVNLGQQAAHGWSELPVPVIAAVHGPALGAGMQVALGADLRIVAPDAQLSILEIRWGLVPDMTGIPHALQLVSADVVKELAFTGRMVSGEEAVELGLATRLADDPRAAAFDLAREIAGRNPFAIRHAKRLVNDAAAGRPLAESFLAESAAIAELVGSPNQVEAVTAFFEKRTPEFADPEG